MTIRVTGASFGRGQKKPGVESGFSRLQELGLMAHLPGDALVMRCDDNPDLLPSTGRYLNLLSQCLASPREVFNLTIGGDHTIALATVAASLRKMPDTALVWVDAHADFNTINTTLTGNLHGMPLHGLIQGQNTFTGLPDFDWLNHGLIRGDDVVLIGAHEIDPKEAVMLSRAGISVYELELVRREGLEAVVEMAMRKLGTQRPLHVSLDVDVMNSEAFAATGCPCPQGLTLDETRRLLQRLGSSKQVIGLDIVEYNPSLDDDQGRDGTRVLSLLDAFLEKQAP